MNASALALRKLNPPANIPISDKAHYSPLTADGGRSLAASIAVRGGMAMMRSKLSPREIVQRLQMIETMTTEGLPVAEALRSVGMREAEYDRWRVEYNGLGRTLGSLLDATLQPVRRTRRVASARKPPM
jgi:hypothetical protein